MTFPLLEFLRFCAALCLFCMKLRQHRGFPHIVRSALCNAACIVHRLARPVCNFGFGCMQIQNLNTLVDTVRHEIIERYRPGEDDPHLKVLQAAHISDDEYFSHMVLDDLNLIIRDIRETHKKDSESAPQTTVANELKENLEAVENFKGSRDEKLVVLYCKQLGINYKNLSDEEFRWLIRILKKSKKMGTPISQRKKR